LDGRFDTLDVVPIERAIAGVSAFPIADGAIYVALSADGADVQWHWKTSTGVTTYDLPVEHVWFNQLNDHPGTPAAVVLWQDQTVVFAAPPSPPFEPVRHDIPEARGFNVYPAADPSGNYWFEAPIDPDLTRSTFVVYDPLERAIVRELRVRPGRWGREAGLRFPPSTAEHGCLAYAQRDPADGSVRESERKSTFFVHDLNCK